VLRDNDHQVLIWCPRPLGDAGVQVVMPSLPYLCCATAARSQEQQRQASSTTPPRQNADLTRYLESQSSSSAAAEQQQNSSSAAAEQLSQSRSHRSGRSSLARRVTGRIGDLFGGPAFAGERGAFTKLERERGWEKALSRLRTRERLAQKYYAAHSVMLRDTL
jgi:hypothetical protein